MIKSSPEQMKAVSRELEDLSVQIGRVGLALEEIRQQLGRQTPYEETIQKLSRSKERISANRRQVQRLSIALETITRTYVRTENEICGQIGGDEGSAIVTALYPQLERSSNIGKLLAEKLKTFKTF